MDKEKLKKYAEVVIRRGINLKKNQLLFVEADIEAAELVREIARQAYLAGAREVGVRFKDKKLERMKFLNKRGIIKASRMENMENEYYSGRKAAYLRIEAPDFNEFKDVPIGPLQKMEFEEQRLRQKYILKSGEIQNCRIYVPCESWARKVYSGLNKEEGVERLWEDVYSCMRLNEPDPLSAWDKYVEYAKQRRKILDDRAFTAYHLKSAVTDLIICPAEEEKWYDGCREMSDKDFYIPYMPTEKVSIVPHKYKANGYVTSTRPLNYNGKIVDKFKLIIEDGQVVDYAVSKGENILKSILNIDEGSRYFGEIALVDVNSPVSMMNTIFYNAVFDENATCHMSLGQGAGADNKSYAERERLGINTSQIHVDFMIGSEDMCIKGRLLDGTWEEIFSNGRWTEPFFKRESK